MSRNRKILGHQPHLISILQSYRVGNPSSMATPEQADEHRASYRGECSTRRDGKVFETVDENGGWALAKTFTSINAAKAATSNRRYAV